MVKLRLTIKGNKTYLTRMYKHLRKEHPSTRPRMKLVTFKRMKGGKR